MNKVVLAQPKPVVVQPEITKTVTEFEIERMVDLPKQKEVRVFAPALDRNPIVVFSGADYDAIGQWTDQDVIDKLALIYGFNVQTN